MITPPKYPRTYHLPWSPEVHGDDKVMTCPDVFIGPELIITEKMDGGCTSLARGNVFARSTGQPAVHESFDWVKQQHAWKVRDLREFVYGENLYARHSITYDRLGDFYMVFGVLDGETWFSWDDLVMFCTMYEFSTVPVLFRGTVGSLRELEGLTMRLMGQSSPFGEAREGLVVRLARSIGAGEFSRCVAKCVREGHVQTDEHWSKNWVPNRLGHPGEDVLPDGMADFLSPDAASFVRSGITGGGE